MKRILLGLMVVAATFMVSGTAQANPYGHHHSCTPYGYNTGYRGGYGYGYSAPIRPYGYGAPYVSGYVGNGYVPYNSYYPGTYGNGYAPVYPSRGVGVYFGY